MTDQPDTLPLDQLAVMVPADLRRQTEGRAEWIEGSYNLCIHLNAARRQHKGNTAFGKWCSDNGFGEDVLNYDTRAATIAMGAAPEALRACLEATERSSVLQVYRNEFGEFSARLRCVSKTSAEPDNEEDNEMAGGQKDRARELLKQAGAEGISSPEVAAELKMLPASASRVMSELKAEDEAVATTMRHGTAVVYVHRDFVTDAMLQSPEGKKDGKKKRKQLEPLNRYAQPLYTLGKKLTYEERGGPPEDAPREAHFEYIKKWGQAQVFPIKIRELMEARKHAVQLAPHLRDLAKNTGDTTDYLRNWLSKPQPQAKPIVPMPADEFMAAVKEVEDGGRILERVRQALPKLLEARLRYQAAQEQVDAQLDALVAARAKDKAVQEQVDAQLDALVKAVEAQPIVETPPEGGAEIIELSSVRQ